MITWIKSHPAQTAVAALSLSLGISSVELYRDYSAWRVQTIEVAVEQPGATNGTDLELGSVEGALKGAGSPGTWKVNTRNSGRLFASIPLVNIKGRLEREEGKTFHPPVPNDWLLKYGLSTVATDVLTSDPDKDGFSTLQEWEGVDAQSHLDQKGQPVGELRDDSTNPSEAASHPPYHTRLVLERVEQIPFHLRFQMHDVDRKDPAKITVQLNAEPGITEYVQVGNAMKRAPFTVRKFAQKEEAKPDGTVKDVSEIVVLDRRSGQEVTLPLGATVNSPESYAVLRYEWAPAGTPNSADKQLRYRLRKNETFQLPPTAEAFRVADIRADGVEIIGASGEMRTIRPPSNPGR